MIRDLGRRGVSAAEFAIMAPVLILLVFGTYDLGNAIQLDLRLERVARAGAEYAIANSSDETAIKNFVLGASPDLLAAEVTVSCGCAGVAMASCSALCASTAAHTVSIAVQRSVTPLLLRTLSKGVGNAVVRLR